MKQSKSEMYRPNFDRRYSSKEAEQAYERDGKDTNMLIWAVLLMAAVPGAMSLPSEFWDAFASFAAFLLHLIQFTSSNVMV